MMKIFCRALPILSFPLLLFAGLTGEALAEKIRATPAEIVADAPAVDWVEIPADDLLVMDLAPSLTGKARRVILQLAPPPFSQGWVANIRKLAAAHWWDGLAIVRVQDNYVAQWGDPEAENPGKARALPSGLQKMAEADYVAHGPLALAPGLGQFVVPHDRATRWSGFYKGWPVAGGRDKSGRAHWLVHCYGMIGAGRNLSPDTGSGAELYAVIGHAPRHLDRNIALVGRVIEGMDALSSLPRGTGALGFYETAADRTPLISIRRAQDLPKTEQPRFAYLSTDSASFRSYAEARANRRDAFFNVPAGGTDLCNIPVPIRRLVPGS
jgi:cyclophilin family peptidyl-prolyl cis-trans isomerase